MQIVLFTPPRFVSKPWLSGVLSLDGSCLTVRGAQGHLFKVAVNQLHCVAHHPLDTAISFSSAVFQHVSEPDSSAALPSSALSSASTSSNVSAMLNVDFASVQAVEQWWPSSFHFKSMNHSYHFKSLNHILSFFHRRLFL